MASVLAMEVSEVDCGAVLSPFSQYPAEEETCWNACSYLQNIQGKETVRVTEWGPVKILAVKTSANSKALTLEEIEVCAYLLQCVMVVISIQTYRDREIGSVDRETYLYGEASL